MATSLFQLKSQSLLCIVCILLLIAALVTGECNVCSLTTSLACVSGNQFQVCVAGVPQGSITTCPGITVCSTIGNSICQAPSVNTVQACQDCNKCDATNTFACTSSNAFSLCLGGTNPTQFTGTCSPSLVCNINNPFICGDPLLGAVATCSNLTSTTSTVAPTTSTTSPTTYCRSVQQNGRFPVGTNISTTCRQYIYCFLKYGIWYGNLYLCPGSTFFDSSTRYCQKNIPARCSTNVRSLSLLNIQLE